MGRANKIFQLILIIAAILLCEGPANAQYITYYSLGARVIDSDQIALGEVVSVEFLDDFEGNAELGEYRITFKPVEVLKGNPAEKVQFRATLDKRFMAKMEQTIEDKSQVLFFIKVTRSEEGEEINRVDWFSSWRVYYDSPGPSNYTYKFKAKSASFEECLADIREFLKENETDPADGNADFWIGYHVLKVPNNNFLQEYTIAELKKYLEESKKTEAEWAEEFPDWKERFNLENRREDKIANLIKFLKHRPTKPKIELLQTILADRSNYWGRYNTLISDYRVTVSIDFRRVHNVIVETLKVMQPDLEINVPQAEKVIWTRRIHPDEVETLESHSGRVEISYHDPINPYDVPDKFYRVKGLAVSRLDQIPDLSNFTELESLAIRNVPKADLSPLAELPHLKYLDLKNLDVSDIGPLSALTNLESLNLSNTKVRDLSPLAGLHKLADLDLSFAREVVDVSPLNELEGLKTLNVFGIKGLDLERLSEHEGLLIHPSRR